MNGGKLDKEAYNNDLAVSLDVDAEYWDDDTSIERLKYLIDANDNKKAHVLMYWDNVSIRFQVDTMPEKHLEKFAKTLK